MLRLPLVDGQSSENNRHADDWFSAQNGTKFGVIFDVRAWEALLEQCHLSLVDSYLIE